MTCVRDIVRIVEALCPSSLAEDWDNVGLLVGDGDAAVTRLMTCLTITPPVLAEAIENGANLIVAHHPLPFRPVQRITGETTSGRLLLRLIENRIAVVSPHTAFDSAAAGINRQLADGIGLLNVRPLVADHPSGEDTAQTVGAGRFGELPQGTTGLGLMENVKKFLRLEAVRFVGLLDRPVRSAAVACGSAGEFLSDALRRGCDAFITGETNFHTCLEAEAQNVLLVLTGHYASERFAVETLADMLQAQLSSVEVWASRREATPIQIG